MRSPNFASLLTSLFIVLSSSVNAAENGLITIKSAHNVATTANKLVTALEQKGMKIFARIDHSAGAEKADIALRPTELVIFGNPKVGAPLMQCNQLVAIDLPQKALIWQDEKGMVWFSYNSPNYLSERHNLTDCASVIEKVHVALANFAQAATE